jgi:transcriptional regulator with XRE-family HTH domain
VNGTTMGDRIRGKRNELRLTQEQLAQRAGLNPKTIVWIEGGKTGGLYSTVQAIAAALDVSVGYLERGQ